MAEQAEQNRLLEWLKQQGGVVTARDLCRSNGRQYPTSAAAETALAGMVKAGLGVWVDLAAGKAGGRPVRGLVINRFNRLSRDQRQDILNFLRSL